MLKSIVFRGWRRRWRSLAHAGALAALLLPGVQPARADGHLAVAEPIAKASLRSSRLAILVPSAGLGESAPTEGLHDLQGRLQELGFKVVTVEQSSRPDLAMEMRQASDSVPSDGGEVAVFVLGAALASSGDLFILPNDGSANIVKDPALIGTEGIRLDMLLRRISERKPNDLVAIIASCQPLTVGDECSLDALTAASHASTIAIDRLGSGPVDLAPVLAAIRGSMTREDEDLGGLARAIQNALPINGPRIRTSATLSPTFRFNPKGLLASLAVPCNAVDLNGKTLPASSDEASARVAACQSAVRQWPYAPHFQVLLSASQEQAALLQATASCAGDQGAAYLSAYPAGQFRGLVEDFRHKCAAADEARNREIRQRLQGRMDDLLARGAPAAEFLALGSDALEAGQGAIAFQAFDEANPSSNEAAAWQMARFYDPTNTDPVYRSAANPHPDWAAQIYAQWRDRSPREAAALQKLCGSGELERTADPSHLASLCR